MLLKQRHKGATAMLVLADGNVFKGESIGASGHTVAEVVFNTAMTGYQEILTDPSYCQQMVTMTYPHIGNTGINDVDFESSKIWASGLIVRDVSMVASSWRSQKSLQDYLKQNNVVAISGVDTRRLTRLLRDKGAQAGCIIEGEDIEQALQLARSFAGIDGQDLAKTVSCQQSYVWSEGTYKLDNKTFHAAESRFHVVLYDFGVKRQIIRLLADRGCKVTVVPATTTADEVFALQPDGIFLSNGPGDPAACDYAVDAAKKMLDNQTPLMGICLGFQILALACGAKTKKMKFGHHGANHPVQDCQTGRVMITSQNHSFCVDTESLPDTLKMTHQSLFDHTLQGIEHRQSPAFAFQGHPEASPGPQDIHSLFDRFIEKMTTHQRESHA